MDSVSKSVIFSKWKTGESPQHLTISILFSKNLCHEFVTNKTNVIFNLTRAKNERKPKKINKQHDRQHHHNNNDINSNNNSSDDDDEKYHYHHVLLAAQHKNLQSNA